MTYAIQRDGSLLRDDGAVVPADPDNMDYRLFQAWVAEGNTPAPYTPPPTPPPTSVSKLGLLRALRERGDWPAVKAALATSEALQEDWDAAVTIHRADPLTAAVIATMHYSDADIDALVARATVLAAV